jgi:transposase
MDHVYQIAGIDVHKSMLAVVISDAAREGEFQFQRRKFGTTDKELRAMHDWFREQNVREAVMESTAQYWKPVWQELEGSCELFLAQAFSNRAPRGRKRDFADAERLLRRHVAGELIVSFVPNAEQRLWRTMTRSKHQLTRDRVRIHSQVESLLEDGRIKLSGCVSDLLGVSSRRMLHGLAEGETDTALLAAMADPGLRATPQQLQDALSAAPTLSPMHREILGLFLVRLELIEKQIEILRGHIAAALHGHQDAVQRLAEVPGYGIDSAQQVIAEVGGKAASFPSPGELASWVGTCPGREESAEVSKNNRSPKGNRTMRRVLNQVANSAVKSKGSAMQNLYRRLVPRLGHNKAIWAVAHRICRLTWKILHQSVRYIEYGVRPNPQAVRKRANKLLRDLKALGYQVQITAVESQAPTV